jgi:hypothetical protein
MYSISSYTQLSCHLLCFIFITYYYIVLDDKHEAAAIIKKINQVSLLSNHWFVHVNHSNTEIMTIPKRYHIP